MFPKCLENGIRAVTSRRAACEGVPRFLHYQHNRVFPCHAKLLNNILSEFFSLLSIAAIDA